MTRDASSVTHEVATVRGLLPRLVVCAKSEKEVRLQVRGWRYLERK